MDVSEPLAFDVEVVFVAPAESKARSFPRLEGPGRARFSGGRFVLEGKVFELSLPGLTLVGIAWILVGGLISMGFGNAGVVVLLVGGAAIYLVDLVQRLRGRDFQLVVPSRCAHRIGTRDGKPTVEMQLDQFLIGGGRRPPLVEMTVPLAAVPQLRRAFAEC